MSFVLLDRTVSGSGEGAKRSFKTAHYAPCYVHMFFY